MVALFGYTNVPVIDNVGVLVPMNGPMLASAHIGTPVQKLTLDPKQELSIDPAAHGIGSMDELAIAYVKTRESYFGTTTWATSADVGTVLLNLRVNPSIMQVEDIPNSANATVAKKVAHVPLSYVGNLFKNWRGDIVLRVKVVCSKFHKGRLKISYDPVGDISVADPPENAVYTEIVDIGERDDFEIRIPYHQDTAWLNLDNTLQTNWSTGSLAPRSGVDNGTLSIRVLTSLVAPVSGDVRLLFFLKGGDNFEFANPEEFIGSEASSYTVPSFFDVQAEDKTDIVSGTMLMGRPTIDLPERYGLNYGEAVHSLRDIMHRSTVSDTVLAPPGAAGKISVVRKLYKRMPYTPGYNVNMPTVARKILVAGTTDTAGYAYNGMHPLPFIAGMYLGYRGGVNYTVTASSDKYGFLDDIRVARLTSSFGITASFVYADRSAQLATGTSGNVGANYLGNGSFVRTGVSGLAITSNRTNASVSFMVPDYNRFNFSIVQPLSYPIGNVNDGTDNQGALLTLTVKNPTGDETGDGTLTIMSAAGAAPDFTCLFWLCCPALTYSFGAPVAP
jgi:hypothetical protein